MNMVHDRRPWTCLLMYEVIWCSTLTTAYVTYTVGYTRFLSCWILSGFNSVTSFLCNCKYIYSTVTTFICVLHPIIHRGWNGAGNCYSLPWRTRINTCDEHAIKLFQTRLRRVCDCNIPLESQVLTNRTPGKYVFSYKNTAIPACLRLCNIVALAVMITSRRLFVV